MLKVFFTEKYWTYLKNFREYYVINCLRIFCRKLKNVLKTENKFSGTYENVFDDVLRKFTNFLFGKICKNFRNVLKKFLREFLRSILWSSKENFGKNLKKLSEDFERKLF